MLGKLTDELLDMGYTEDEVDYLYDIVLNPVLIGKRYTVLRTSVLPELRTLLYIKR